MRKKKSPWPDGKKKKKLRKGKENDVERKEGPEGTVCREKKRVFLKKVSTGPGARQKDNRKISFRRVCNGEGRAGRAKHGPTQGGEKKTLFL